MRFDLLEELLLPLARLPEPEKFLDFLTSVDGRAIPVSPHAYEAVSSGVFDVSVLCRPRPHGRNHNMAL